MELLGHIEKEHSTKTENNVQNTKSQDRTICISKTEYKVSYFVSDEVQIYFKLCIIKCKSKKALDKRMNSYHEGHKSCEVCGKKLLSAEALKNHA